MRFFLVFVIITGAYSQVFATENVEDMFQFYRTKYNWSYNNAAEEKRGLGNFISNANKVAAMNKQSGGKDIFYVITKYADMDAVDLNNRYAIDIKTYINSKDPNEENYNNERVNLHGIMLYDLTNSRELYKKFKEEYNKVREKHGRRIKYLRFVKTLVDINRNNFAGKPPRIVDENADIVEAPEDIV